MTRKNSKSSNKKATCYYKRLPIRSSTDFSAESLQARREWHDISTVVKDEKCQSRRLSDKVVLQN